MAPDTRRLFIALDLDPAMRRALHEATVAADCPDLRPVPEPNLHLTLKFLGDVLVDEIDPLIAALHAWTADAAPFPMTCPGPTVLLPSARKPRLIAAEVEPTDALGQLAECVELACQASGFAAEDRPFRPHITLGRFKTARRPPRPRDRPDLDLDLPRTTTAIDHLTLIASTLTRAGPIYEPRATIVLTAADDAL